MTDGEEIIQFIQVKLCVKDQSHFFSQQCPILSLFLALLHVEFI